jgi:hypothetical protein
MIKLPNVQENALSLRPLNTQSDWVLVSEITHRHWVVVQSILIDLESKYSKYSIVYQVSVFDTEQKTHTHIEQVHGYGKALDIYHEKIKTALELYS